MKRRTPGKAKKQRLPLHSQEGSKRPRTRKERRSQGILLLIGWAAGVTLFFFVIWRYLGRSSGRDVPFYIPQMRDDIEEDDWEWPLVHIVKTRFMQEQGTLTALGAARLGLFKVFCLPTMQKQTTQQFLWIIKTDPNLDPTILKEMIDMLSPFPNFYLVASNVNFRVNEDFPGAWRGGAEVEDLAQSIIYTGSQTLLEIAMAMQDSRYPVLETRLDADDGLHIGFLQQIQSMAIRAFEKETDLRWLYWCSRRHVAWHWNERPNDFEDSSLADWIGSYGALVGMQHSSLCITPGITVGFAVGVKEADVPVWAHDELIKKIRSTPVDQACGYPDPENCLQFMENFVFEAIRSRSPTSAGMLKIALSKEEMANSWWLVFAYFNMLHDSFGIRREPLKWINYYISDHLIEIAEDNLMGQCTTGHSCKVG